jgi:hypothetical protein
MFLCGHARLFGVYSLQKARSLVWTNNLVEISPENPNFFRVSDISITKEDKELQI